MRLAYLLLEISVVAFLWIALRLVTGQIEQRPNASDMLVQLIRIEI
jgi:hypothetical protein